MTLVTRRRSGWPKPCSAWCSASWLLGVRYIPHNKVGIVEKLWSVEGLAEGGPHRRGRAARPASRPTSCAAACTPSTSRGSTGSTASRSCRSPRARSATSTRATASRSPPMQTLGRVVACNNFQDARAFLAGGGQRGRQRAILREGVYAINLALFVVVAEDRVYQGPVREREPRSSTPAGRRSCATSAASTRSSSATGAPLRARRGRADRRPRRRRQRRATTSASSPSTTARRSSRARSSRPRCTPRPAQPDHDYFQDPEALLALGGRRGKQLQVLTDGTYFVNRWFATVEFRPKTRHPDRLRRRGRVVLRQPGRGPDGRAVPLRRAGGARPPRRVAEAAASRKVPAQPVRAEGRTGADGELRPALDHRA